MDKKASTIGLLAVVLIFSLACATTGTAEKSVGDLDTDPPNLMIQQTSDLPVYLVVDSDGIPAEKTVLVDGQDQGGTLTDVDQFVRRDLRRFFENYYDEVQVVEADYQTPSAPHLEVRTQLQRVEVQPTGSSGNVSYGAGVLTWGLGIAYSEADEFLFSITGDSAGAPTGDHDRVFRSMFEAAISDLGSAYSDDNVHEMILQLPEEDPDELEDGTTAQIEL